MIGVTKYVMQDKLWRGQLNPSYECYDNHYDSYRLQKA